MNLVNEIKHDLLAVIQKMNVAAKQGIKIEFNIAIANGESTLERFVAFQQMKIEN